MWAWQVEEAQELIRDWGPLSELNSYWRPGAYEESAGLDPKERAWGWSDLDENSIIFEIGGYIGTFTQQMIERYQPYIYFFEPSKRVFELSREKFKEYPKIEMYNFGLGTKNGTFTFGKDTCYGGSFLTEEGQVIQADMVDIAEFITKHNVQHIDYMQINIEGGEYYLLPYLINTGIIKIVRRLMLHWHECPDLPAHLHAICDKLYETHHIVRAYTFEVWERKSSE